MDTLIQELEKSARAQLENNAERENNSKKAAPKGRGKVRWMLAGGLIVAAALGAGAYLHFRDRVSTDDAQVDAHIAPIAPKVGGNVSAILVDDNEAVTAGQILLKIDPRDLQAKVAQARAALAQAEGQSRAAQVGIPLTDATTLSTSSAAEAQLTAASADFDRAKADYARASSSDLAYSRADIESKRATSDRARADLARMQPLVAKDEISKQQFDSYVASARVAESDLAAAEQKLVTAERQAESSNAAMQGAQARVEAARAVVEQASANRQQVDISSAQAGTATAGIQQARANLDAAELELSYTTVKAPINGIVTRKSVQLGQIVQPGQTLLTVVPVKDIWITANFKETQLSSVRKGQKAEVHVDMYGRSFEGEVDSIASATGSTLSLLPPENATGNFVKIVQRIPVKVRLEDMPEGFQFRPGMNVDVTVYTR